MAYGVSGYEMECEFVDQLDPECEKNFISISSFDSKQIPKCQINGVLTPSARPRYIVGPFDSNFEKTLYVKGSNLSVLDYLPVAWESKRFYRMDAASTIDIIDGLRFADLDSRKGSSFFLAGSCSPFFMGGRNPSFGRDSCSQLLRQSVETISELGASEIVPNTGIATPAFSEYDYLLQSTVCDDFDPSSTLSYLSKINVSIDTFGEKSYRVAPIPYASHLFDLFDDQKIIIQCVAKSTIARYSQDKSGTFLNVSNFKVDVNEIGIALPSFKTDISWSADINSTLFSWEYLHSRSSQALNSFDQNPPSDNYDKYPPQPLGVSRLNDFLGYMTQVPLIEFLIMIAIIVHIIIIPIVIIARSARFLLRLVRLIVNYVWSRKNVDIDEEIGQTKGIRMDLKTTSEIPV